MYIGHFNEINMYHYIMTLEVQTFNQLIEEYALLFWFSSINNSSYFCCSSSLADLHMKKLIKLTGNK